MASLSIQGREVIIFSSLSLQKRDSAGVHPYSRGAVPLDNNQLTCNSEKRVMTLPFALSIASAGCIAMLVLRIASTGTFRYVQLAWNLILAWIPYVLTLLIKRISSNSDAKRNSRFLMVVIGVVWLFFYPNSPYILTDFIHVVEKPMPSVRSNSLITTNAILWYDIILHSAFAFVGHIIGLISLVILHRLLNAVYKAHAGWTVALVAILLGGYGIYLGRFERLNSWDVFKDPLVTMRIGIINLLNPKAVLFAVCFGFFIFLTYLIVYSFYETAHKR